MWITRSFFSHTLKVISLEISEPMSSIIQKLHGNPMKNKCYESRNNIDECNVRHDGLRNWQSACWDQTFWAIEQRCVYLSGKVVTIEGT